MAKKLIYLVGRDRDLNANMSLHEGKILIHLKNYMQVHIEPIKPEVRDEYCYGILVDEDKVVECMEDPRVGKIHRLWEGPKNNRGFSSYTVQGEIYPLDGPGAVQADDMLAKIKEQSVKIESISQALKDANDAKQGAMTALEKQTVLAQELDAQCNKLSGQVAGLQQDLVKATTGGPVIEEVDVKLLAEVCKKAPAKVLEALPHIGEENKVNVLEWADEVLGTD